MNCTCGDEYCKGVICGGEAPVGIQVEGFEPDDNERDFGYEG